MNHAMPRPRAAHCTHQWPGDVITLITSRMSRMSGALDQERDGVLQDLCRMRLTPA